MVASVCFPWMTPHPWVRTLVIHMGERRGLCHVFPALRAEGGERWKEDVGCNAALCWGGEEDNPASQKLDPAWLQCLKLLWKVSQTSSWLWWKEPDYIYMGVTFTAVLFWRMDFPHCASQLLIQIKNNIFLFDQGFITVMTSSSFLWELPAVLW